MNSWQTRRQTLTMADLLLTDDDPVVQPATGYTPPQPQRRWTDFFAGIQDWPWAGIVLACIGFLVCAAIGRWILDGVIVLPEFHLPSRRVFSAPATATATPAPAVTIIYETQIVERIVLVTPEPATATPARQLPTPRQPQPAAWPAPAQPTAAPRVTAAEPAETWVCADGYSYTPGAWDWLNGVYTEKQADGSIHILESGRGVGNNPLRHKNCKLVRR